MKINNSNPTMWVDIPGSLLRKNKVTTKLIPRLLAERSLIINKLLKTIIFLTLIISINSCEETFIGQQPKFLEEYEVDPGLNIFGILRPDSLYGLPASFVTIGIIAPAINDSSENWQIKDADVFIAEKHGDFLTDTMYFKYQKDSLGQESYFNSNFAPKSGKTYLMSCKKEGYDEVLAIATIPPKPEVLNFKWENNKINLVLNNDTAIHMYDIYAQTAYGSGFMRFLPEPDSETTVINEEMDNKPMYIDIYAYEKQLANYHGSTNVFIKPNTYRPAFSTVENGYGCLGALNYIRLYLN